MTRPESSPPSAKSLVSSMRALGYELETAISDLIDNSIFACAKNIRISWSWNYGAPWILIADDGKGMTEIELRAAMKPGSQDPEAKRHVRDLGRFGLGLKTASWSQCKLMTVLTKTLTGEVSQRQWDLDLVEEEDEWLLVVDVEQDTRTKLLETLTEFRSGTAVLWQRLDRITDSIGEDACRVQAAFDERFTSTVLLHLEMTFHRFLTGKDRINLTVGRAQCLPWDPFLSAKGSEERPTETFDGGSISVTPFVLPHSSNLTTTELQRAQGPWGWSEHQGFYLYRNRRMITSGGYLGLTGEDGKHLEARDHFRLCRIRVDLPNNIDHEWHLDVRKAQVSPPLRLRREFQRLALSTRQKSAQVYRKRTVARNLPGSSGSQNADIWHRKKVGAKLLYHVNRRSPAVEFIRQSSGLSRAHLNALLHLVERTVPYRGITVDNNDMTDATVDLPIDAVEPPTALIELAVEFTRAEIERGKTPTVAVDHVCQVVMPLGSPQLRLALEKEFLDV